MASRPGESETTEARDERRAPSGPRYRGASNAPTRRWGWGRQRMQRATGTPREGRSSLLGPGRVSS